jgi:hypothetical protein
MTISAAHMHEDTHIDWSSLTPGTFWVTADKVQDDTLSHATEMFSALETVNEKALKEILIQYRYFTVYYITDLALLIAGMEDSPMRSFLADILYDELGCGKADGAHPRLYDNFLSSIGVRDPDLNALALRNNIELLDDARRHLVAAENGSDYGVGLRGMGGECVCQIYIAQLHQHLIQNPYVRENYNDIDWRFWDLHVGDHDIEHREKTRALIDSEVVAKGGEGLKRLGLGYGYSMKSWKQFWINIFELARQGTAAATTPRGSVKGAVSLHIN